MSIAQDNELRALRELITQIQQTLETLALRVLELESARTLHLKDRKRG